MLEIRVTDDLAIATSEEFWRAVVEKSRVKADEMAAGVGGTVRTNRHVEFTSRVGQHMLVPGDFVLVGTRWWVDVPESFTPGC
jgi:hypothetical protein